MDIADFTTKLFKFNYEFSMPDISSLGITVAEHLGIPSILIANFPWDLIY